MLRYDTPPEILAFTCGVGCHGTEPGVDARETGLQEGSFVIAKEHLMLPRQTHSTNVAWVHQAGELPDTDAVITDTPNLCIGVKTADCIPILLYDSQKRIIAAVHAGWRGTVGRIAERTVREMGSAGTDIHAIIGPGISLQAFEVGDEVYDTFLSEGFPMTRIARRFPTGKWHIDLWEANRWQLEQCGITDIYCANICTRLGQGYYSARRDTIRTGRNINGIMLCS